MYKSNLPVCKIVKVCVDTSYCYFIRDGLGTLDIRKGWKNVKCESKGIFVNLYVAFLYMCLRLYATNHLLTLSMTWSARYLHHELLGRSVVDYFTPRHSNFYLVNSFPCWAPALARSALMSRRLPAMFYTMSPHEHTSGPECITGELRRRAHK